MARQKISIDTEDYVNDIIDTTKKKVIESKREHRIISADELIPTGSTLLNLSLSDNYLGGYSLGKFSNLIGDQHAGKSLIALNMLAECCYLKRFNDYDLIYDDVEVANEFDIDYLFSSKKVKVSERIIFNIISDSAEDFYGNIYKKIKKGKPFIYVLDTFDAIASEEDRERASDLADGKKAGGTYGTSKPKLASEMFRTIKSDIKNLDAFLLVISQTRDNIGFGAKFKPKTRSGGKALGFYSAHENWLSVVQQVKEKDVAIGAITECKCTKNKLTGKKRHIRVPIFSDYGIDDISANVDFLVEEGHWKKKEVKKKKTDGEPVKRGRKKKSEGGSNIIVAEEFGFEGVRRKIIYDIENDQLDKELSMLVGEVWKSKEDSLRLNRRPRYEI